MTRDSNRGRALLRAQADPNAPLGEPPDHLAPAAIAAWRDIVAVAPPVLRRPDGAMLAIAAMILSAWRLQRAAGIATDRQRLCFLYRVLGDFFVPIAQRRRLLFGDSVSPSRARR